MKYFIILVFTSICLVSCSDNSVEQNELLKSEILDLQSEIRLISNDLEAHTFLGQRYTDTQVRLLVDEFKSKRSLQSTKVRTLKDEYNEIVEYETIVCGDFESVTCFVDNWDIIKPDGGIVEITSDCSYNESNSLRLSAPFIENKFNIPGVQIEGYINGIESTTIYKIRFWMKYSGTSDLSNGPLVNVIIMQDGDWLDYLYEGFSIIDENKSVDKDWELYSFQIATLSDSPLEIFIGTNLENVCIDDIHIVKKD